MKSKFNKIAIFSSLNSKKVVQISYQIEEIVKNYNVTDIYLQNDWTKDELATENEVKSKIPNVNFYKYYNQWKVLNKTM